MRKKDWSGEMLEKLASERNGLLLEAFRMELAQRKDMTARRKYDLAFTTGQFAATLRRYNEGEPFFLSDMISIRVGFEHILDRFVIETTDVDREIMDEVFDSVREFFGFLAREGVVGREDYDELCTEMAGARPGIEERMDRYSKVRRSPDVTPGKKAKAKGEIFGIWI